jgi:hydrogenase expression/formation protein HypD
MEFCGGHTHAIFRYGVQDLMPDNVSFVHGPGCPVCVLPVRRLDDAVELAERHGVILCTYGDMMRVPGTKAALPDPRQGGRRRYTHGLFDHRRPEDRPRQSGSPGRLLRHRL